ncbi:hypothetical protein VTK73DRAFT_6641 [Phialemonium thermophilum]|uniref:Major facilitator superfamily (MFS) profile domain-containing protein n=1 Tax=Phialemonium thermophilum TaxID=223376 RepID=A0ABR3WIV8_9PEZI
MGFLDKLTKPKKAATAVDAKAPPQAQSEDGRAPSEKDNRPVEDVSANANAEKADDDSSDAGPVQLGVLGVEAAASVWSKWHLVAAYATIWFIYFITSIQEVVVRTLNPYVTSAFQLHSLTAATSIMSSIIGGLFKIPLAKLLDTWGRPEGLTLTLFLWVIGFIMMAACKNVETYAAAQVFSTVGCVPTTLPGLLDLFM